jgi:hypothetical protein
MTQAEFFELIYGGAVSAERRICVFTCPGERAKFWDSPEAAAEYVAGLPRDLHVYHGVSLVGSRPSRGQRGSTDDMMAYGCLWCDVDIVSPAHPAELPPTIDDALALLDSLPIAPSLIVNSGWGIHGYWVLENPVTFATAEDRAEAGRVAKGWHGVVCDAARARGWKLPNLGDLPRVLRTPGTVNAKDPSNPRPVKIIRNTGEVVGFEDFREALPRGRPSAPPVAATTLPPPGVWTPLQRCTVYMDEIPPAIDGSGYGGTQTLVACKAIYRFGLDGSEARAAFDHYNAKCVPPWTSEKQIQHKLDDAKKSVLAAGEWGKLLEDEPIPGPPVDLSGIVSGPAHPPAPPAEEPFPEHCLRPPGLLADVVDYNLRRAMYAQPQLALAGALALLAVITGQKIRDARGTRTNLYVLGVAPSGAGKEHARQVNKDILVNASADGERMVGPERIGSSAGIVTSVSAQPAILFQIDELGKLLATMRSASKSPHLYNIGSVLLQLYSSSASIWVGDAYAEAKKVKRINQPHACVYGTSTPEDFWGGLTKENVSEGLLGRLLVFEGEYVRRQPVADMAVPGLILERVRSWLEFRPGPGALAEINPRCLTVETSPDAVERLDAHLDAICERREKELSTSAAVWSRSGEKTAKLALLFACSRWAGEPGTAPVIEYADVDRAVAVTNWLTRRMLRKAFDHVSENGAEELKKKVLRTIVGEMTWNELTRRTQWLRGSRERNEVMQDLQAAGYVVIEQRDTGGRPATIVKRVISQ